MTITFIPTQDDLTSVVDQVWETFIATDEPLLPAELDGLPDEWNAVVTIDGDWSGSVAMAMTDRAARIVAAGMLGMSVDEEMADEDIADAVGELINVVGGNVKSLLGGHSQLSLPVVATGHVVHPGDAVEVGRIERSIQTEAVALVIHTFEGENDS